MVRLEHYDWTITPEMLKRPFNLRFSREDSVYRKWQAFEYRELDLAVESPDSKPVIWICTGTYASKPDAIIAHNEILKA